MCSLTYWPLRNGYRLGMNRDERRDRVQGVPPQRVQRGLRTVVRPAEPGGGTWISLNDQGIAFALLNAYSLKKSHRNSAPPRSRGLLIPALCDATHSEDAATRLRSFDLERFQPFRLMGWFSHGTEIREWLWNGDTLTGCRHPATPLSWHSSGYQEPEAQRIRSETFRARLQDPDAGSLEWIRRLHGSHHPDRGPFSVCMHRPDAATVSYSEIEVDGPIMTFRHHQGSLCERSGWSEPQNLGRPA